MDSRHTIVVHIGAGYHSPKHNPTYKKLLKSALGQQSVQSAASIIERNWLTNTGRGANLNRNGQASLDASYLRIESNKVAGALAITDITDANPTRVLFQANEWLDNEFSEGSMSSLLGLLRPLNLHYSTFLNFLGFRTVDLQNIIRQSTRELYETVSSYVNTKNETELEVQTSRKGSRMVRRTPRVESQNTKKQRIIEARVAGIEDLLSLETCCKIDDTVGVLCISPKNDMTGVTSSGGTFFKIPGRMSCAGVIGAGIAFSCLNLIQVFTMCTGNGDDITRMGLASHISDAIVNGLVDLSTTLDDLGAFVVRTILRKSQQYKLSAVDKEGNSIVYVGTISIVITPKKSRLVFCHSTESFYFGFNLVNGLEVTMSRKENKDGLFLHGEFNI